MLGFLNVYKPEGITSNGVVQKIKKKFHIKKIGHMGTLDPMATGILPVAIGKATRLFDYSLNKTKRYIATFDFGYTTDTIDATGERLDFVGTIPTINDLERIIPQLIGKIDQVPPSFSAKNINGRRAYDLARDGIEFELKPKQIEIYEIKLLEQVTSTSYKFDILCSSGTYIRSIARDMAAILDTYSCMVALERVETGYFNTQNCISLDNLLTLNSLEDCLISPKVVFNNFDKIEINDTIFNDLINGKKIQFDKLLKPTFIEYNGSLVGVAKTNSEFLILDTFLYE